MGKATIISEQGAGLYTIRSSYNNDLLTPRIAQLTLDIAAYTANLPTLESNLDNALAEYEGTQDELDDAIRDYNDDRSEEHLERMQRLTRALAVSVSIDLPKTSRALGFENIKKISAEKEKAKLEAVVASPVNRSAWCVTYTQGLTGEVNTIEINGEEDEILIGEFHADSEMTEILGQTLANSLFNFALTPYWQKWNPTHRIGTIDAIDGDTATITLDAATSHYQNLQINQSATLTEVPFDYMTCDEVAFEVGDEVVIGFTDQDWANPVIIGFKDNPQPCFVPLGDVYVQIFRDYFCFRALLCCKYPPYPYDSCDDIPLGSGVCGDIGDLPPDHESYCPDSGPTYGSGYPYSGEVSCPTSPEISSESLGNPFWPTFKISDYSSGDMTFTISDKTSYEYILEANIYRSGTNSVMDFTLTSPWDPNTGVPDVYNHSPTTPYTHATLEVNYWGTLSGVGISLIGGKLYNYEIGTEAQYVLPDVYSGNLSITFEVVYWNGSIVAAKSDTDPDTVTYYSRMTYTMHLTVDIQDMLLGI